MTESADRLNVEYERGVEDNVSFALNELEGLSCHLVRRKTSGRSVLRWGDTDIKN